MGIKQKNEACELARKSLLECLSELDDPRMESKSKHKLIDILVISLCANICGAECFTDFECFGNCKKTWFSEFLELPNGIPSHDTFTRVFELININELIKCYEEWVSQFMEGVDVEHFCVDGKTIKGSKHHITGERAIHMLSVYSKKLGLVIAQEKIDEKSNEITAIPRVLERLNISGVTITIDAMGCQKSIAEQIYKQGGEYVLALKGNQEKLAGDVVSHFENASKDDYKLLSHDMHEVVEKDHGRIETRRYDVIHGIEWLDPKNEWGGLSSIGMVTSTRNINSQISEEKRYYISNFPFSAEEFGEKIRSHWAIENSLHWVLDVSFGEDSCQVRSKNSAANLNVLRKISLALLKQGVRMKCGIKTRRKVAGWDENYLLELIKGKYPV